METGYLLLSDGRKIELPEGIPVLGGGDISDSEREELVEVFVPDSVVCIDKNKCVGCHTCVLVCPYGAIMPSDEGVMQKCELCIENAGGKPACVQGCPNKAIIFEERE